MSNAVAPSDCCSPNPCDTPQIQNIPGPQGTPGHNAFSTTTAGFTVPAVNSTVVITLADNSFAGVGEPLFIVGAGGYQVTAVGTGGQITVKNLGWPQNAAQNTNIGSGSLVTPAGAQGSAGTLNSLSPTTTKGDLLIDAGTGGGSAAVVRFPAGTNNNVLHTDSTQTDGAQWRGIDLSGANTNVSGALNVSNGGTGATTQQNALNSLMPSSPVQGDLCKYNGTNWVRFPIPTTTNQISRNVLRVNAAGTDAEWAYQGIIQRLIATYTTASSTTAGIALGNTAPTSSNGKLLLTQAITPSSTTTKVLVRASVALQTAAAGAFVAIFNGTTCVAVAATQQVSQLMQLDCIYSLSPASVSPITFNVYSGYIGSSGTVYFNSTSSFSGGIFAGTCASTLIVEEHG